MPDLYDTATGELIGDFDQYISFKSLIEGFFNNLPLEELINRAEKAIRFPIVIVDLGFYIIAESESAEKNADLHMEGRSNFLSLPVCAALKRFYVYDKLKTQKNISRVLSFPFGHIIVEPLFISKSKSLLFIAFSPENTFTEADFLNVKKSIQVFVLEFQKESSKLFYRPILKIRTADALLDGAPISPQSLELETEQFPWIKYDSLHLMIIHAPRIDNIVSLSASLSYMLRQYIPRENCVLHNNYVVCFLSHDMYLHIVDECKTEFDDFMTYNHLYCTIGREYTNIQATSSEFTVLKNINEVSVEFKKHFTLQSEMSMYVIADILNKHFDVKNFCHPAILKLRDYDRETGSELVKTLYAYITDRDNVNDVADRLYIKRSTLFYRLNKIKDLTGLTLKDSEELFHIYFTYKILITIEGLPEVL